MPIHEPSGHRAATGVLSPAFMHELRSQLGDNARLIIDSIGQDPDDFDGREPLWMERCKLLRLLDAFDVDTTTPQPVQEAFGSTLQFMRDVVAISSATRLSEVPAALAERLELDEDSDEDPYDIALEMATCHVLDATVRGRQGAQGAQGDWIHESVELLLTCGGPTVTLTAALGETPHGYEVERVRYYHSWGAGTGQPAAVESADQAASATVMDFLRLTLPEAMGER